MADQAVFVGWNVEKLLSILRLEKGPPGHRFTPYNIRWWPILCTETVDSVQGQNTLSTNYLDRLSNSSDISDILFGRH